MDFLLVLAYAIVYFAGYYGAHFLNLGLRRVVVGNLRFAGLAVLGLAALVAYVLIDKLAPPDASAGARGYIQGRLVIGPVLIVGAFVAVRMWLDQRKLAKGQRNLK